MYSMHRYCIYALYAQGYVQILCAYQMRVELILRVRETHGAVAHTGGDYQRRCANCTDATERPEDAQEHHHLRVSLGHGQFVRHAVPPENKYREEGEIYDIKGG